MNSDTQRILLDIERDIAAEGAARIEPLPCDKWLASSAWQKSVRRGQPETALRAAMTFWETDRRGFWRRMLLASVEDIGVGCIDTVTNVLAACAHASWRGQVNDLRVALHLTRLMCAANKSRLADQVFIIAERAPEYAGLRTRLAAADDKTLADYVLHEKSPLVERALCLWYLAGHRRFPSERMPARVGSVEKAVEVLQSLNAPADLKAACIAVLIKTQYPLALFTPLLAHSVQHMPRPLYIWYDKLYQAETVNAIPAYAADTFTRVGKAAIRQLQQAAPDLKPFSTTQIGLAVFYAEGGRVDKELTGETLTELKQAGEIADIEGASLCLPRYLGLRECLTQHWDRFEAIRRKELRRYLDHWRDEQAFERRLI
ncbi:MAG: hypothetical protein H6862_01620 [Rhodospirillales bacterium]|nr:hypothetical protein [Rhodospirillales bacterium]